MEALAFVSGIRPSRVETDFDLIKFGATDAKVEAKVINGEEPKTLTVNFAVNGQRIGKTFFIDAFKKRLLDFVPIFSVVIFEPVDLDLVTGSPSLRRHHLDRFLAALDIDYWRNISAYAKVVTRRNRILQRIGEGMAKQNELNFWDQRLVEHGKYVSRGREEFFEFLNFVEHGETVGKIGDLSWELKQSLVTEEKLRINRERDIAAGVTLSGPHRDDFRFIFKKRDLEFFGSRGEQRMSVLALKLAELEYYKIKRGARPVLALDDIFSELDWEHRETVLSVIGNQQTIITAAERESIPKKSLKRQK